MDERGKPPIYLTFDDGPDPAWTPRVLAELRAAGATATFFVMAPLARSFPALIREIVRDGHAVGLHCVRHVRHTELDRTLVAWDTRLGLRDLHRLELLPRLWRPPWGVLAPWTEAVAQTCGLDLIGWNVDTHDWRGDTAIQMLDAIGPNLGPGSVILMHDALGPGALRSGCEETVALIGGLVERVREVGCQPAALASGRKRP